MIKVLAVFHVKEGMIEKYLELVKELVSETLKEKGCLEYAVYKEDDKPGVFTFFEEWESKEDLDIHLQSDHIKNLIPQIEVLLKQEINVQIFSNAYQV